MAHYPFYTHNLSLVGVCIKRIGKVQARKGCVGIYVNCLVSMTGYRRKPPLGSSEVGANMSITAARFANWNSPKAAFGIPREAVCQQPEWNSGG